MRGRLLALVAAALALGGITAGLLGAGFLGAAPAAAAVEPGPSSVPALVVTSEPSGTVHLLVPGETVVWPVEVRTVREAVDSLQGQLSATGELAASGALSAEVLSCTAPWAGDRCRVGSRAVLPLTRVDRLPGVRENLQAGVRPSSTTSYLQVRVTYTPQSTNDTAGLLAVAVLRVDASGPDGGPDQAGSALADTGARLGVYGALAAAAVVAGLMLAGCASRRRRSERSTAALGGDHA